MSSVEQIGTQGTITPQPLIRVPVSAFIAFQDGGVLSLALCSAWQELARRFTVSSITGTSGGAIMGALCAAGYDPAHAIDVLQGLDWKEYVPKQGILRMIQNRIALNNGEQFFQWLQDCIVARFPDAAPQQITFSELYR